MNQIDAIIFLWTNAWVASAPPFVQQAIALRAWLLPWLVFIGLAVFALGPFAFQKYRSHTEKIIGIVICSLLSAGIARFVIVEIIRRFVERPRPFEVFDDVFRLIPLVSDGSFPSGHAALFFALAAPFALARGSKIPFLFGKTTLLFPKTTVLFCLAAFVISIDRILGGVHWPSDVLVGALIGIGTAWCVSWFMQKRGYFG